MPYDVIHENVHQHHLSHASGLIAARVFFRIRLGSGILSPVVAHVLRVTHCVSTGDTER